MLEQMMVIYRENGGKSWRKINFQKMIGLPKTAFVNDIKKQIFTMKTLYTQYLIIINLEISTLIYIVKIKVLHGKKLLVISQITHYYGG